MSAKIYAELEMKFPKHLGSLHLSHNPHKSFCITAEQYIKGGDDHCDKSCEFESEEEIAMAISSDEIWEIQWYPKNSVTSYAAYASTLDGCLSYASIIDGEIK